MKKVAVEGCTIKLSEACSLSGVSLTSDPVPVTTPSTTVKSKGKGAYVGDLVVQVSGATCSGYSQAANPVSITIKPSSKAKSKSKSFILVGDKGKISGVTFVSGSSSKTADIELEVTDAGQSVFNVT